MHNPLSFSWHGVELEYETSDYNDARHNERAVEVPVASHWVGCQRGRGLEVGAVLGHYRPVSWPVVDRYEGPIMLDLFDWHEPVDWIVSVSTIEHVRFDCWGGGEIEDGGSVKAVEHLRSLLRPGGAMLVTVPFGVNRSLDESILFGELETVRSCTFLRDGSGGWRQSARRDAWRAYGPAWANAVWIGEFEPLPLS